MSRKHTAKEFDKSNKWLAIGVDLAKYDNTIGSSDQEFFSGVF